MENITIGSLLLSILGIVCGLLVGKLFSALDILTYQAGVDYYSQVHLSFWNSLFHTIFMPFTYMGFNIAIPAMLCIKDNWYIQWFFYVIYMTHYFVIDPITAIFTALLYYQVIKLSHKIYMRKITSYIGYICLGLFISTIALGIQEYYGHYIGGDDPSRLNVYSIFNAILYAKFYSVQHLVRFYRYFT